MPDAAYSGSAGAGPARRRGAGEPVIYCIVPEALAPELHDLLRRHFSRDPGIEVVVERRVTERRAGERRQDGRPETRRAAERRIVAVATEPPKGLPARAQLHLRELRFVLQSETTELAGEDRESAQLVRQFQRGDDEAFSSLYLRYFDRVYAYMKVVLEDAHGAEDATQQVFIKLYEALPRYQERGQPFRAFLFVVARNHAVTELRRRRRLDPIDPVELDRYREPLGSPAPTGLPWVSDRELLSLVERLPLAQRQVLVLRFMMDLSHAQIGQILERTPEDVRALLYRALSFMRKRLDAMGRTSPVRVERMQMQRRPPAAPVTRARRAALVG